jgi:O-methyltransferase domain
MTELNPFATLRQIAGGYCLSPCLHVVAKLGVADKLDETPRTGAELAATVGAHAEALSRVLRLLAAHGVFESLNGKFSHSPASRMLRTDHPQSMRDYARLFGLPPFWAAFGELEQSVRTGQQVGDKVTAGGLWAYFAQHPEANAIFNATMAAKAHANIAGIIAAYDFSGFKVIGDIGGGRGHLLRAVLDAVPAAKGVLFDQAHVVKDAAAVASPQLALQAGDFFKNKLPVCDAYLLMEVIHDWSDAESISILQAIRKAAVPHAKLLLIEEMMSAEVGPDWAKMMDINMLVLIGGKQRTREEYAALFDKAGFSFKREVDTGTGMSILEAVAV